VRQNADVTQPTTDDHSHAPSVHYLRLIRYNPKNRLIAR
jgi:hypothetical protein